MKKKNSQTHRKPTSCIYLARVLCGLRHYLVVDSRLLYLISMYYPAVAIRFHSKPERKREREGSLVWFLHILYSFQLEETCNNGIVYFSFLVRVWKFALDWLDSSRAVWFNRKLSLSEVIEKRQIKASRTFEQLSAKRTVSATVDSRIFPRGTTTTTKTKLTTT